MKNLFYFFLVTLTLTANADWKQSRYEWLQRQKNGTNAQRLTAQWFTQKIDHFSSTDDRTFKQRYYIDSSLAENNHSPVLFYLCGEAACKDTALNNAIRNHATKFKAHMVALEHRYYGESQPFDKLTTTNLKFLSIRQALQDAAVFQKSIQTDLKLSGKWISVGGSYPGSLSAYYREKFPELVVGALASSGPVKAKEDFEEYDHHVWKVAGESCSSQIKKAVGEIETILNKADAKQTAALKERFSAKDLVNDDDFLYLVADMAALAAQYGYRDRFCDLLKGNNPLEGYATFTKEIFKEWKMTATDGSVQGSLSEDPKDYPEIGMRQWFYQSCTEYGYWQIAYHDEKESTRSKRIDLKYHRDICQRLFGIDSPVDTKLTNDTYYEPLLKPSTTNILFTNGSQDPWSTLSIQKVPDTSLGLTAFTIEGAAHCDDLRKPKFSDSDALIASRNLFVQLAESWLAK